MQLSKIHIQNFKRYESFTLHVRNANILVGPNNSGKSTILDTLRLLNACLNTARIKAPKLIDLDGDVVAGYEISSKLLPIQMANVARDYSSDDAILNFTHQNGSRIRLCLNPLRMPRFYLINSGRTPRTSRDFLNAFPCKFVVIPQMAPFEADEQRFTDETVRKNRSTRLAARNFRNIWVRSSTQEFEEFQRLVEASWPGVSISRPEWGGYDEPLRMFFSENRIDREIYWAGYGFQILLQILTHMLRMPPESILVMDEPDVYLHADLQKRLLKIVDGRFSQYFLATHSTEIINEAEIGDILSINPTKRSARRISGDEEYQSLYNYIGSSENAELAKLARAKRIVFFEGGDRKILKKFAQKLGSQRFIKDTETMIIAAGGFGQWRRVTESAWALNEVLGIEAGIISIFDRDYRSQAELDEIADGMARGGIKCYFWDRKEIENYALELNSLSRLIRKRAKEKGIDLSTFDVENLLMGLTDEYHSYVESQLQMNLKSYARRKECDPESALSDNLVKWGKLSERFLRVPGKIVISDICRICKEMYGISLSLTAMIDEMHPDEISETMKSVLTQLDEFCHDEVSATLETLAAV